MIALAISVDGGLGWILVAAAPVAAVVVAIWAWRATTIRDVPTRAGIAVLRGLFVGLALALLADPSITRTVERLPRLLVRWSDGSGLELADAPGGATRRAALETALDRARSLGLEERFELVDGTDEAVFQDGSRLAGTLLLAADAAAIETFGPEGRVLAIVPPRDTAIPDLSVLDVDVPARAASGAPVEAVATIRARGAAGRRIVVTLSDGARVARSAARDVTGADETFSIALGAVFQNVGWQKVTVEAAGVTGEVSLSDNRIDRWIELESETRRVLLVEGAPTWEGKFVRRALEKDPTLRVDYATSVSREAVVDVRTETGEAPTAGSKAAAAGAPSLQSVLGDEKRLFAYDAIVIGPLDASALSDAVAERLVRFVDARGGGIVVLGGNAYAGSVLSSRGPLARLVPAEVPARALGRADAKVSTSDGSVVLAPANGFAGHPAFATLGEDPVAVLGKLQKLGGGYLRVGALAPGAEIIAVDGSSPDGSPLVVAQRFGAGRVTLVAPSDTWRLSVGAAADLEDVSAKFWTGLVGWTTAGARGVLRLQAQPTNVNAGVTARFVLDVRGKDWAPRSAARIEASAELETAGSGRDGDVGAVAVRFVANAADPGRFVADVVLPGAGTWLVTATVDGGDAVSARVEVRAAGEAGVRPDPSVEAAVEAGLKLRGGALIRDGSAEALLEVAGSSGPVVVSEASRPARGIWWAFVLPLLFAGEAFLRRRAGLDAAEEPPLPVP